MNKKKQNIIILVLGALAAMGPFSIDMYLPGFPQIANDLHTDIKHVAYSLTSYFVGISIGQLLYGPLIDRFGRKKPLIVGLSIYLFAAIGCAFAQDIYTLIGLRLILAIGACVGMVAGRAIIRDLFPVSETARMFSMLMLVMGVAPIVAPTLGGMVTSTLGWRYIFVILAIMSVLVLWAVIRALPESKGPDRNVSLKPTAVLSEFAQVFRTPGFMAYTLAGGISMAGMFAYISASPFVFMNLYGLSDTQYGWIFGLNAFGLIAGSQLNRVWLKRRSTLQVSLASTLFQSITGLALIAGTYWLGGGYVLTLTMIFSYLFWQGFISPNATAMSLAPFSHYAGSASALIGAMQMLSGALASALVGYLHNGTAAPMTLTMGGCAITASLLLYSRAYRSRKMSLQQ